MKRFVLAERARTDVEEIWEYIAADDADAADRVVASLHRMMGQLAHTPGIGRPRRDVPDSPYWFMSVGSYVIAYKPGSKPLAIVRVVHGRRNFKRLFGSHNS